MSFDVDRLYELLPAFYRLRDIAQGERLLTSQDREEIAQLQVQLASIADQNSAEAQQLRKRLDEKQRGPLKTLLSVIAEQVAVLEEDLEQLYDDQFIETCAEWVVPYIGDLVGTRGLFVFPDATFSQRAQVANTIAYRRPKGTAAVLEQLARDVTGWHASVVEYFQLLATTQYMNHLRPQNLAITSQRQRYFAGLQAHLSDANLSEANERQWRALAYLNTPFDTLTRTVEVRRIESRRGKYNIPNIGIFLWRLGSYSVTRSPAFKVDDYCYLFNALGTGTPLYTRPETEDQITHLAKPINVPIPISRHVLERYLDTYYGVGKSLSLTVESASPPAQTLADPVRVCDLSDVKDANGHVIGWAHMPQDTIAIDPVLGRIAFPTPPLDVHVTYHYGFSASMGGGEYGRADTFASDLEPVIQVPSDRAPTIQAALDQLAASGGVVEIVDNAYYIETPRIKVPARTQIELRAADEHRPVLVLGSALSIVGGEDAEVTLNGLVICGGFLHVPAQDAQYQANTIHRLRLQHCTLLPGPSPAIQGVPPQPAMPRLLVEVPDLIVEIEQCIVGGLRVVDSARVWISNSIVDATAATEVVYAGLSDDAAGAPLEVQNSTIIGQVYTDEMTLASNTIFIASSTVWDTQKAPVRAAKLQQGCVRFSFVPPDSQVPRQFHCQPQRPEEAERVRPVFTSLHYGDAGYGQLSPHCALEIRQGADDAAEMGAFHNLYQPQREANLRVRLDEYLRFGLEAGILYAS